MQPLSKVTKVWLALLALTAVSWFLTSDNHGLHYFSQRAVTAILLGVALFKARLVIMNFMEVAEGPVALRLVFEAWVLIVYGTLMAIYAGVFRI